MPVRVDEGLYLLKRKELFCNVYVILGKKIAIIDSGLKSGRKVLLEMLKNIAVSAENVDLVLHTHGHVDHFSNSKIFKKAKLLMHKEDAKFVNKKDMQLSCAEYFEFEQVDWPKVREIEDKKIKIGDIKLEVLHTPGHSKGSVCFLEAKRKWLFSGDTLFRDAFGRFDLPGANRNELINSLKKLYSIVNRFNLLLPGHGLILKGNQRKNLVEILKELE